MVDVLIIIFIISALFRGKEIGFVQQLFSTVGFFGGLLLGAALEPHTVRLVHSALSRTFVTLATTLGCAFVLLVVGEYVGITLKHKVQAKRINAADNFFGSLLSAASFLVAIWLGAAILTSLPYPGFQQSIKASRIISTLTHKLPAAPGIISDFGHLIDPNGFPDVFIGNEPNPPDKINLPSSSALAAAVTKDKASVVKIEGQGCGGIVEGSGFVVGNNLVATNAHVVAGINHPYVQDANGTHSAVAVWFDPNLDFAVLRVSNLAGGPLVISSANVSNDTPAAVMGYPGGGGFDAEPASVLDQFTAVGRNIYNSGHTERDVYEIAADIIPGNSGGPLVAKDGTVIGVIFAQSTSYNHVGYALTTAQISSEINQAAAQNQAVSTGNCAE
ncbi:MAG TPA: MarP family serine protease [Candidatus Saccharimonadales bacterium]|nr:MarP family serine protease [Candidatus Saccharimonadales bacterium]